MPKLNHTAKLVFPQKYGVRDLCEARERGYLSHVLVSIDDNRLYPVVFFTPTRLQFELDVRTKNGEPFVAETGMIVVSDLTLETIERAIQQLCDEGYFNYAVAVTLEQIDRANPHQWPP